MITTAQLHDKVRALLNEAVNDATVTLLTDDTRSIDNHIKTLLPDAVLFVQRNKGMGMLNPKAVVNVAVESNADGVCRILLPDDFVALVSLQLNGWLRPCTVLFPADSAVAHAQFNKYTRSGSCKPVCVETISETGERTISCYSLPPDVQPSVQHFIYEAAYNVNDGLSGDDEALHNAVAYQCAGLVYTVFELHENASVLFGVASAYCNNHTQNK